MRKEDSLMFNQYEVFLLAVLLRLESDFYDDIINSIMNEVFIIVNTCYIWDWNLRG